VRLAERGVKVKATGFGRVDLDVADALGPELAAAALHDNAAAWYAVSR
jgi:hypothetical protein